MKKYLILAALALTLYRHTHSSESNRLKTAKSGDMQSLPILHQGAPQNRRLIQHQQSVTSDQSKRASVVNMESIPKIIETEERLDEKIKDTQLYFSEDIENFAISTGQLEQRTSSLEIRANKIEELLASLITKK